MWWGWGKMAFHIQVNFRSLLNKKKIFLLYDFLKPFICWFALYSSTWVRWYATSPKSLDPESFDPRAADGISVPWNLFWGTLPQGNYWVPQMVDFHFLSLLFLPRCLSTTPGHSWASHPQETLSRAARPQVGPHWNTRRCGHIHKWRTSSGR